MKTAPAPLKPGATIGVAAPAGPCKRALFDRGLRVLQKLGYRTHVPDAVFDSAGYLAGSDRRRAQTVNRLFADPAVDAVICARGGYGSLRVLPLLDFEAIGANPKMLLGFSDISALLAAVGSRSNVVTYHGPTVTTLAGADPATVRRLAAVLADSGDAAIFPEPGRILHPGRAEGVTAGGNLATLCHLLGTAYAPDFSGSLLLLEDVGEAPYRIDRMLTQMRLSGCLDAVAGIFLGSFVDCGPADTIERIVTGVCGDLHVPILAGFHVGHGQTNLALPLGAAAVLDADRKALFFNDHATDSRHAAADRSLSER